MAKEKSKIIDVVKRVCPAVLSVMMSANLSKMRQLPFFPFEPFGPGTPSKGKTTEKVRIGGGSGFFISPDGLILTNRHVVSEENVDYLIVTANEKEYEVEILAKDPINDIAILKVKCPFKSKDKYCPKNFPFLELGDSNDLELGQTVIAVGNVLGQFSNTVSTGVISGLSRYITATSGLGPGQTQQLRGLIQTDAAVNPGNSGGPLVDIFDKVIGINAAIVLGAQNIGFTIPINSAKKDLADYKKYGRIRQPFFGVRHLILNEELKKTFNLPIGYGALVIKEPVPGDVAVVPGSPADKAQLKEKDIILEINKHKITEKHSLQDMLQQCKIGDEVALKIWRDGQIDIVKTKIEEKK